MSLSHVNEQNQPQMVDVSSKKETLREASAETLVFLPDEIFSLINSDEIHSKKGPVFQTAIIGGVMAAKKTSDLIPFCHPIPLEDCKITISPLRDNKIKIICTTKVHGKTGVEMEALTGASAAALIIYDMCKAMSHEIQILETKLIRKTGGKQDFARKKK